MEAEVSREARRREVLPVPPVRSIVMVADALVVVWLMGNDNQRSGCEFDVSGTKCVLARLAVSYVAMILCYIQFSLRRYHVDRGRGMSDKVWSMFD